MCRYFFYCYLISKLLKSSLVETIISSNHEYDNKSQLTQHIIDNN